MSNDNEDDTREEVADDRLDETTGDQQEQDRMNASRRTVLQGVAAGSVAAGFGGIAAGQETTTEQAEDGPGFFREGPEVGVQEVANGQLTAPTDFAHQADDERYFVTDQTGQVYTVTPDGGLSDEPFIDISDRMVELGRFYGLYATQGQAYDERGLLGIDLHPNFAENGRFYLHYSAPPTEELRSIQWDHIEVVSEFQATEDASSGNPDSEQTLLRIPSPQYNHDAGPMAFGPDGYLYVPMGDGGGANDDMYGHSPDWYAENKGGNGQDVTTNLMGNILRIDVDSEGEDAPYGIPDDNPFSGDSAGLDEIYAYGFRNPFGISFDSEGRLFTADLGQNLFEEVDIVEAGGNYGWNVKEGTHCFSTASPTDPPEQCPSQEPDDGPFDGSPFIDPIAEYPHTYQGGTVGIAVVGGHFYEQNTVSGLGGKYVFGDWTADPARGEPAGRLLAAVPPAGEGTQTTEGGQATQADATTDSGQTTEEAALQDQETTTAANETETPAGKTATEEPAGPGADEQGQVVPRDELWEMEELDVRGGFDWFVRQFGQNAAGEIFVLVNKRGIPEGDTGAVLKIVPPGEGDAGGDGGQTTQTGGETTQGGEQTTSGNQGNTGEESPQTTQSGGNSTSGD